MAQTSPRTPVGARQVRTARTFRAFQSPGYRLLWASNVSTYASQWMQVTLLTWLVLDLTDSPLRVSLIGFFGSFPLLALGIFGGMLSDLVDRRKLIRTTQTVNLLAATTLAALLATGSVQPWQAYLMALVTGVGVALDFPSRRALMLDMLGAAGVTNAVALDTVAFNISRIVGPVLAGALIDLSGVTGGFVAVSFCYLVAVAMAWRLKAPQAKRRLTSDSGVLHNLAEGLRYVRASPTITAVVLITVIMNLLLFNYTQMVPVVARDVLQVGPGLMGVLMAAEGIGALAGAVVIASASNLKYLGRLYAGGSFLALMALLLFALSRWYALSFPALLVLGLGTACFGTMQSTIVMLTAREEMRGRALGVVSLAIGASPLGALLVGAVADAFSAPFAIGLNAALGIGLLALVLALVPSLWQHIPSPGPRMETRS